MKLGADQAEMTAESLKADDTNMVNQAVHAVLQHIMAYLLEPVCQVNSDQVAELGVCQRYVCAAGHIRPRVDAVLAGAVRQGRIQGCAVHDTVAEGAELGPLHAHNRVTRALPPVQQGPASCMLCSHSIWLKVVNSVEQSHMPPNI